MKDLVYGKQKYQRELNMKFDKLFLISNASNKSQRIEEFKDEIEVIDRIVANI